MPPAAAEVARTLATARRPGRLLVSTLSRDVPVAHATTTGGEVLLAARRDSPVWLSLAVTGEDEAAVVTVEDVPPFPESPWLGRVHLCGWIHRVPDSDVRRAGCAFAEVNPLEDLLDLGTGVDLFRLELGEVRLDDEVSLEAEEFVEATPDPLYSYERELLQDLRDHHLDDLATLLPAARRRYRPVRLDRYGLVVAGPDRHRVEFTEPVDCPACVSRVLRLSHLNHP